MGVSPPPTPYRKGRGFAPPPLAGGGREEELLRCPWHGWEFDIRTGQSWCDPDSVRARTYSVTVEPGEALAKGPFVAETLPVRRATS